METDRHTGTLDVLLWLVGLRVTRLRRLSFSEEVENWGKCEDIYAGGLADKMERGKGMGGGREVLYV